MHVGSRLVAAAVPAVIPSHALKRRVTRKTTGLEHVRVSAGGSPTAEHVLAVDLVSSAAAADAGPGGGGGDAATTVLL